MSALLLETGLTNALVATLIAAIVWLCTRIIKNPYVASLLWLGVLAKFITPPLISLSIPQPEVVTELKPYVEELTQFEQPTLIKSNPISEAEESTATQASFTDPTIEEVIQFEPEDDSLLSADDQTLAPVTSEQIEEIEQLIAKANSNNQSEELPADEFSVDRFSNQPFMEPVAEHAVSEPQTELVVSADTTLISEAPTTNAKTTSWHTPVFIFVTSSKLWLSLWLATTLGWFSVIVYRGYAFGKLVRQSLETSDELQQITNELSQRLELARPPHIKIVDAAISPMIWPFGRRSTILFPRHFLNALPKEKQSLVIAHELAHLKRHDHQFRWLELIVLSLYWWLPTVRFIRRELHIAQEKCCDAWVVHLFPDQTVNYSETLLTAAQMLSKPVASPVLATEFGRQNSLRQRIETMLKEGRFSPLSRKKLYGCLLLVGTVLLFSLKWTQANPEPDAQFVLSSDPFEISTPNTEVEADNFTFEEPLASIDELAFEETGESFDAELSISESTAPTEKAFEEPAQSDELNNGFDEPTTPQPSFDDGSTQNENTDPFGEVNSSTTTQSNSSKAFDDSDPFGPPPEKATNSPFTLTNPEMQAIVNPLMELLKSQEPNERQQAIEILGPYMAKLRKSDKQSEYAKRTWETYQLAYLSSLDSAGRKQVLPQLHKTEPEFFLQYFVNSLLSTGIANRLDILELYQPENHIILRGGPSIDERKKSFGSTGRGLKDSSLTVIQRSLRLPYTPQQLRQAVQRYSSLVPTDNLIKGDSDAFDFTGPIKWDPVSPIFNETILKNYIANITQLDKLASTKIQTWRNQENQKDPDYSEAEDTDRRTRTKYARKILEKLFIQILQATPTLQNSVVTMAAKTTDSIEETPVQDFKTYALLLSSCNNLDRKQMPQLQKLLKSGSPELQKAAITTLQRMLLPPEKSPPNDGKVLSFDVSFHEDSTGQKPVRSRKQGKRIRTTRDDFIQIPNAGEDRLADAPLRVPQQNQQIANENSKSAKIKSANQPQASREIPADSQPLLSPMLPVINTTPAINDDLPLAISEENVPQNKEVIKETAPAQDELPLTVPISPAKDKTLDLPKATPQIVKQPSSPDTVPSYEPKRNLGSRDTDEHHQQLLKIKILNDQRKKRAEAAAKQRDELIASLRELLDDTDPAVQQEARKQLAKIDPTYVLTLVDQILAAEGDDQYYQLVSLLLPQLQGSRRDVPTSSTNNNTDSLTTALDNLTSKEKHKQFLDLLNRFLHQKKWTIEQAQKFENWEGIFYGRGSEQNNGRGGRGRSSIDNDPKTTIYQPNFAMTRIIVHCIATSIQKSKQTLPNLLELAEGEANIKIEESPNTQFLINWLRKDPLDNSDNSPTPYAYIGENLPELKKGLKSKNAKIRIAIVTAIGNYLKPPKQPGSLF